jgi:hypothetical protein
LATAPQLNIKNKEHFWRYVYSANYGIVCCQLHAVKLTTHLVAVYTSVHFPVVTFQLNCQAEFLQRWKAYSLCQVRVESEYRKSQVESKYEYHPAVLDDESEYRHCGTRVRTRLPCSRTRVLRPPIPRCTSNFYFFRSNQTVGVRKPRRGEILQQDSQVTRLLTYRHNCGAIYYMMHVTCARRKTTQNDGLMVMND